MQNLAHYYSKDYGNGWNDFAAWLTMLLFIGVLALLVYLLIQGVSGKGPSTLDSALDEARKRYAKGEINKKQLDEIRKELKK